MIQKIPNALTRSHILKAIEALRKGRPHPFGESTGYDVLFEGQRYAPKAVVGLAATELLGVRFGPKSFKGGVGSQCFRTLAKNGFTIITKGETSPFPDEVSVSETHIEGAVEQIIVNRYERDMAARGKAIQHHGAECKVCGFDFQDIFGAIGEGFIHVHHTVPLSKVGKSYQVNPIKDLVPVCPNCHAMLHKRIPPYSVEELRNILKSH